ncbi:MAG TPA: SagB/ThcOx family dehydrogenase [Candidatus Methanoperedens sp.]|nr:SagB/ThcOx family dehydrogenase [Candidatus Methanoperedens sp.]
MRLRETIGAFLAGAALAGVTSLAGVRAGRPGEPVPGRIALPAPMRDGTVALERALQERRSVRAFRRTPLTLLEVAQLLWASQGISWGGHHRTVPSAGALYPLEIRLVAGEVEGLPAGVYRYLPAPHALELVAAGDRRRDLCASALGQECVSEAPAILAIAAVFSRTTGKYGGRGERYAQMEAGNASQNVYLQAAALGLGTVLVGAFHDDQVRRALALPPEETPLALMPLGRRAE